MCDINLPSVILAGGRSQRMNRKDKSFLEVGDKTLLDMTIERLQLQSRRVAINTNSHSFKYKRYGLPILHDQVGILRSFGRNINCHEVGSRYRL